MHCRPTVCPTAMPSSMKNINLEYTIIVTTVKSRNMIYTMRILIIVYKLITYNLYYVLVYIVWLLVGVIAF